MEQWRIVTWNVQGSRGLDRSFVCEHINRTRPDVFVVQEVTRRQTRSLGAELAMTHAWARKHIAFPGMSEGLAILTPHSIASWRSEVLSPAPIWSWRRRIMLRAHIVRDEQQRLGVLNVHLSPHDANDQRKEELVRIGAALRRGRDRHGCFDIDVVAGDFNDNITSAAVSLQAGGRAHDVGAGGPPTCWTPGKRIGRLPSQRMDGAISLGSVVGIRGSTPSAELDRWGRISDHLPVTIDVSREVGG